MNKSKPTTVVKGIQFESEDYVLNGYLHLPPTTRPPFVLGSHGLLSDKNSPKQITLARHCNQHGIAYFRFDHRGCGQSKASYSVLTSLEARCTDLIWAAHMLRSRDDLGKPMGLFGSSMGGSACLTVAQDIQVHAVVTWAAPLRSADLVSQQTESTDEAHSPFLKQPFDISARMAGLGNVLIIHGDADETVPRSHADGIYHLAGDPKKLLVFPQGDHRMGNPADQQAFVNAARMWFEGFLLSKK